MQNKAFNITIIAVIILLIGFVVWQQANIMGMKSDLLRLESSSADVESIVTDLAEVKSTLAGINATFDQLGEIESSLRSYQKLAILALASYSTEFAESEYYLATLNLAKAQSYLDDAEADQGFFLGHLDRVDELMNEKVALLQGEQ